MNRWANRTGKLSLGVVMLSWGFIGLRLMAREATRPHEVWLGLRTNGRVGNGTESDPFDCSRAAEFDRRMALLPANTHIHLCAGTFQTRWNHAWSVKDGWIIEGAGISSTTVKIVGNLAGNPAVGVLAFSTPFHSAPVSVVLRNFTIDCNWAGLANSADSGAPVRTLRNDSKIVRNATITSKDGAFTPLDTGRAISGAGIPPNSWIGVVNSPSSIGISASAVSNMPVLAEIPSGTQITISEKNCSVAAAYIYGARGCSFDHICAIHGYGSSSNQRECFGLALAACPSSDASDNSVSHCTVKDWYGNYANPFALAGFRGSPSYPGVVTMMTNSRVEFCTAIGRPGIIGYPIPGSMTPFTSGGVNLADVKNCAISHNRFEDCQGAAYQDTGSFDGIEISDNTVIRGFQGIAFAVDPGNFPGAVFRNLKITRNRLNIQRRYTNGANYGILVRNDCSPVIEHNTITYDRTGPGGDVFWPLSIEGSSGTIRNNTIDGSEFVRIGYAGLTNGVPDSRYHLSNNRTSNGQKIAGLPDINDK